MPQKKSVLLIGYDSNLCLGVIYCLKSLGYNFYVLTWNKRNAAKYSRYVNGMFYYVNYDNLEKQVIDIVDKHKIDIIMPFDELEIRWVKTNYDLLSRHAACTWGTSPECFDVGINKKCLAEFLSNHHLPCPSFSAVKTAEKLQQEASNIGYPLLIKPTRSSFGRGIKKIANWKDLQSFYKRDKDPQKEYIIQPFILGSDVTCNVICRDGEILCHTIQESPVKYGSNFSSNDVLEFHDDGYVLSIVTKMMRLLHWNGVACIDMRRDAKDQSVMVLEINGRFWASVVSSFIKAGINFPEIMAKLALAEPVNFVSQHSAKQISIQQYLKARLLGKRVSIAQTKYVSYFADPLARFQQVIGH